MSLRQLLPGLALRLCTPVTSMPTKTDMPARHARLGISLVLLSSHVTRPFRRSSPVRTRFRRPRRAPLAAVPMGYSTGRCRSVRRRAKNKSGPARPRRTTSRGSWTYGPGTSRLGLAWGCRRRRRRWIPTVHALLPSAPAAGRRRNGGCQDIGRSPTAVPGGGPRRGLVRCWNGHAAAISRECLRYGSVRRALFRTCAPASRERPITGWETECGLKSVSRPLEIHTAGGRNPGVENSEFD